jgi:hypothetical protein
VAQTHWFGRVFLRLERAFLRLEKDGYTHEGHGIVRAALEHALVARWVGHHGLRRSPELVRGCSTT